MPPFFVPSHGLAGLPGTPGHMEGGTRLSVAYGASEDGVSCTCTCTTAGQREGGKAAMCCSVTYASPRHIHK